MAIATDGVSKQFADHKAVDDVSLEVAEGSLTALLGPSGCGKSTLLSLVSGLLPATSGAVVLNGSPVTDVRTDVGFIFQRDALLPWKTVRQNVRLPLAFRGKEVSISSAWIGVTWTMFRLWVTSSMAHF